MPALLWLADVLRAAGLTVHETVGWQTRGRPNGAGGADLDMRPVGLICHATAGSRTSTPAGEVNVLLNGSQTAPPPISQLFLARTGEFWVIAAGVCNHAGSGGLWGVGGNSRVIGIEAANDNRGEPWPRAQLDAYRAAAAAICRYLGWSATQVAAHREWNPAGKTDPVGVDMPTFRAHVAQLINEEDIMPSVEEVWTTPLDVKGVGRFAPIAVLMEVYLRSVGRGVLATTAADVDALQADVDGIEVDLDAILTRLDDLTAPGPAPALDYDKLAEALLKRIAGSTG